MLATKLYYKCRSRQLGTIGIRYFATYVLHIKNPQHKYLTECMSLQQYNSDIDWFHIYLIINHIIIRYNRSHQRVMQKRQGERQK